jgi:hypothetical protein
MFTNIIKLRRLAIGNWRLAYFQSKTLNQKLDELLNVDNLSDNWLLIRIGFTI